MTSAIPYSVISSFSCLTDVLWRVSVFLPCIQVALTPPAHLFHPSVQAAFQISALSLSHHRAPCAHFPCLHQNTRTKPPASLTAQQADIFWLFSAYHMHSARGFACDLPPTALKSCNQRHILPEYDIISDKIKQVIHSRVHICRVFHITVGNSR